EALRRELGAVRPPHPGTARTAREMRTAERPVARRRHPSMLRGGWTTASLDVPPMVGQRARRRRAAPCALRRTSTARPTTAPRDPVPRGASARSVRARLLGRLHLVLLLERLDAPLEVTPLLRAHLLGLGARRLGMCRLGMRRLRGVLRLRLRL